MRKVVNEMDKHYDVCVAHTRDDSIGLPWVAHDLTDHTEKQHGNNQERYNFDRNSIAGNSIIGETIYGIQQSRKVLFVSTDDYIKTGLWEIVLYWAVRQGLDNTIICCLGDMDIDKMPPSLAQVAIDLPSV